MSQQNPWQQPPALEVDDSDRDSAIGETATGWSSTISLTSSITKYREENGRRYHAYKDGVYFIPNDNAEQERLDTQHNLFLMTFGGDLYLCPAGKEGSEPVQTVLDVGTGTGIWAMDFADAHPESHVIGVDLSPIQPSFVPPNLEFQIDDLEDTWSFSGRFDFIYARMMTGSFANWPRFFNQCYENLNPGGWIEVCDIAHVKADDDSLNATNLQTWCDLCFDASEKAGRSLNSVLKYKAQLEEAGFTAVTERIFRWPMNRWPKDPNFKDLGE
jgi:SAM-dependent methyltransferase